MAVRRPALYVFGLIVMCSAIALAQVPAGPPPQQIQFDPTLLEARLAQAALDVAREGSVTPIPLDTGGTVAHGVIYDRFQLGVVAAKFALKGGRTPSVDITMPGRGFVPASLAVVAYALHCGDRTSAPQDVRLSVRLGSGGQTQAMRPMTITPSAASLLPGVDLPASSRVVAFPNSPLNDATVTIDYAEPLCPGEQKMVEFAVRTTPVRATGARQQLPLPASLSTLPSPTQVRVQALIGLDGTPRQPMLVQGPPELESAAIEAFKLWRFEPARTNGTPVVQSVVWPMTFGAPSDSPALMASSTGAGTHNTATAEVSGMNRASSLCAVSSDPTYGFSATNAIRVGGDVRVGPAREVQYLNALRGPNGEGLRFRRLGSTMGPNSTILDLYEITYTGLATPLRVYVDEYHFEDLKAPAGLICGGAIGLSAPVITAGSPGAIAGPPSTSTNDEPGLSSATSKCPVAYDDGFAMSPANAIHIADGKDVVTREEQFVRTLRGPDGKGLRFRRTGAMLAPDQKTVVDVFEITYAGASQPIRVHFDRTQSDTLKAPKGWACTGGS